MTGHDGGNAPGRRALLLNAVVAVSAALLAARVVGPLGAGPTGWAAVGLAAALLAATVLMDATRVSWGSDRAGRVQSTSAANTVLLPAALLLPPALFVCVGLGSALLYRSSRGIPAAVGVGSLRIGEMSAAAVVFTLLAPDQALDPASPRSVASLVAAGLAMLASEAIMVVHLARAWDGLDADDLPLLSWRELLPETPEVLLAAVFCLLYPAPATVLIIGLIAWSHVSIREHAQMRAVSRDPKTGLLSWPAFEELATAEIARSRRTNRPLALLLMDLDGLKAVNTRHGHLAGDQYINTMAGLLTDTARAYDLLARFGGDEFALLLPDTAAEQAAEVAERIRATAERARIPGVNAPMSVSIGIAAITADQDLCTLARSADNALRRAKADGRNQAILAT